VTLAMTSLSIVTLAMLLPLLPMGTRLGFVPPPFLFFLILVVLVTMYLLAVERVKQWFYRRFAGD
jgi:Mg2+-importing ATPase